MSKIIKKERASQMPINLFTFEAEAGRAAVARPFFEEEPAPAATAAPALAAELPDPRMAEAKMHEIQRKAYEEGFQQGERHGTRMGEEKLKAIFSRFEELLREIARCKQTIFEESERDVVLLSLEIARKLVRKAVQIDDEIVQTLIKITLNKVARHSKVTLFLNPADHQMLLRTGNFLEQFKREFETLEVMTDDKVDQGGCRAETSSGIQDATITQQFKEIEGEFLGLLKKG